MANGRKAQKAAVCGIGGVVIVWQYLFILASITSGDDKCEAKQALPYDGQDRQVQPSCGEPPLTRSTEH
jgi:hypothetical protein